MRYVLVLLTSLVLAAPNVAALPPQPGVARSVAPRGEGLRIADKSGLTPPVVNERGRIALKVVDAAGTAVPVASWSSDDSSIAKVNRKGKLSGRKFGFTIVTAVMSGGGTVTGYVAVVRLSDVHDTAASGDTKTDTSGNIYLSSPRDQVIYRARGLRDDVFAGKPGEADFRDGNGTDARLNTPTGLGIDNRASGGIYVADTANHCVRRVNFRGDVTVAVGAPETPGTMSADVTALDQAVFRVPRGVAAVGSNYYVADTGNHAIYYVDAQRGEVRLVAGRPGEAGYVDGTGRDAMFDTPSGLAINGDGSLLAVADTANGVVRLVRLERTPDGAPAGIVTTLGATAPSVAPGPDDAFRFEAPTSVAFDRLDNVYVVDARVASVVTRAPGRLAERVSLAQAGSLRRPQSLALRGARAFVLDETAALRSRVRVAEVGPPAIVEVTPNTATLDGGIEVTISGGNFSPDARVVVGDAEVTDLTVESPRRIRFRLGPQQEIGGRTLSVLTRGGSAQALFHIRPPAFDEIGPGEVTTVAGGGVPYLGDGSVDGAILRVDAMAIDAAGNIFVADRRRHRIRRIEAVTRIVTTVAGTGVPGYGGDGGLALAAQLWEPTSVAVDGAGNLYIADFRNHRIRRVDAVTQVITTVAGTGSESMYDGDLPVPVASTPLVYPVQIALRADGSLFAVEAYGTRIWRIDFDAGTISTYARTAATGINISNLAFDSAGRLHYPDGALSKIFRVDADAGTVVAVAGTGIPAYDGDGRPALETGLYPGQIGFDANDNLYVTDFISNRLLRIDSQSRIVTTVAGTGVPNDYGDLGPAAQAGLERPGAVLVDGAGEILIATHSESRLRRIAPSTRTIHPFLGYATVSFDRATSEAFFPNAVASTAERDLLIADSKSGYLFGVGTGDHLLRPIVGVGKSDLAPRAPQPLDVEIAPFGVAISPAGAIALPDATGYRLLVVDPTLSRIDVVAGTSEQPSGPPRDGDPATEVAVAPLSAVWAPNGDLLFADSGRHTIRRVTAGSGIIGTVAGNESTVSSGDGGPATDAGMQPDQMALDSRGNLYFIDWQVNRLRRIDAVTGIVTTVAGGGAMEPVGGLRAIDARFESLRGLAIDAGDNIFVGSATCLVRIDAASGRISIAAGTGERGDSGDGGPAGAATFTAVGAVGIDRFGNVYVVDTGPGAVRAIKAIAVPRK
jgi:sugar lactone lactonase YvrE